MAPRRFDPADLASVLPPRGRTLVQACSGESLALAKGVMTVTPRSLGPWMGLVTAFLSIPLQFVLSNDAYYFGVVPVIAQTAAKYREALERLTG